MPDQPEKKRKPAGKRRIPQGVYGAIGSGFSFGATSAVGTNRIESAPMPTVAEIMDRQPASVSPGDTIQEVIEALQTHDLPGLPVVDEVRKVVGIVTESDLVITNEDADFHLPHFVNIMGGVVFLESTKHWEDRARKAFAATAEEMMTKDPITVGPDEPAEHAGRLISDKKHNRLPVVDDEGRLVGVVTRVDVLAALTGA